MTFLQDPPQLGNQFEDDALLQEYLARVLPADQLRQATEEFSYLGALAGGELYAQHLAQLTDEPVYTQWDAWGNRVDHIEVTALWKRGQELSARHGLVATGYDAGLGPFARVHQHIKNYLLVASLQTYSCPLAMTDGAARTLLDAGNQKLIDRALPRLLSRDPAVMWTSGQWMTERIGGSDVGQTETVARKTADGWELTGVKWFTSATTSDMAITLARPEGNPPGSRGLAVFYLELRDDEGRLQGIRIHRLKDKFGTKALPTAELTLDRTPAQLVADETNGVRNITPMLNITRTWNAVGAALGARRAIALAQDYARRRKVFGDLLVHKPLHVDTLAGQVAEANAMFLMAFRVAEVLGRVEAGEASHAEGLLLRALTPIAKLTTGKQAVAVASETLEFFGGAGYVEDTGLPRLLADAQVLPIWEGTTNVLALDLLRALADDGVRDALLDEAQALLAGVTADELQAAKGVASEALGRLGQWLAASADDRETTEANARRFALGVGRTLQLGLLLAHAQWCLDNGRGGRAAAAARRFAQNGIINLADGSLEDNRLLV